MSIPLAIGAVFRGENRYLREWIEFHRLLGVGKFFLYNHDPPETRALSQALLAPYEAEGLVVQTPYDQTRDFQTIAYKRIIKTARKFQVEWLALIDLDEFLFAPEATTLLTVLPEYARHDVAGIGVAWRCYGPSHLEYAPMLQTEAFVWRAPHEWRANEVFKYILRPTYVESLAAPVPGTRLVDENFETLQQRRPGTVAKLRINHYATRSVADWRLRVERGFPEGAFRLMEKDRQDVGQYYAKRWFEFARDDEYDPCLHRFVPALKTRLGIEH
jgi:hypothetical protein